MRYFVSYAYGGVRHAHDQGLFIIPEITHDNFDESIDKLKLLIKQKYPKLALDYPAAPSGYPVEDFPAFISILFWKEI